MQYSNNSDPDNPGKRPMAPEFPVPKGFHVPDGNEESPDQFEAVCKFRKKPDGKNICLIQMGDFKFHYEEPHEEEKQPDYKDYAKSMVSAMDSGGGNPGGDSGY